MPSFRSSLTSRWVTSSSHQRWLTLQQAGGSPSGYTRVNGEPLTTAMYDRVCAYGEQFDTLWASLTAREHRSSSPWEVKHWRGGLLDLEFIAQYLQLREAHRHPEVLAGNTAEAFRKLGAAGILDDEEARFLASATRIWRNLQGLLRLTVGRNFDPESAPEALKRRLARTGRAVDFATLERNVEKMSETVRAAFARHIGEPAE